MGDESGREKLIYETIERDSYSIYVAKKKVWLKVSFFKKNA